MSEFAKLRPAEDLNGTCKVISRQSNVRRPWSVSAVSVLLQRWSADPLNIPVSVCGTSHTRPHRCAEKRSKKKKIQHNIQHNREDFMLLIFIYCSIKIDLKKVTWCLLQDSASWLCQQCLVNTGLCFSFLSPGERIQTLCPPHPQPNPSSWRKKVTSVTFDLSSKDIHIDDGFSTFNLIYNTSFSSRDLLFFALGPCTNTHNLQTKKTEEVFFLFTK